MKFFYTVKNAKIGDVIPFYNEDEKQMELFYLKNWNPDCPQESIVHGWHRLTTKDHIHFEEMPTGIVGGTGSIVKADGKYHMFYCSFEQNPNRQYARHAVSNNLADWTDIPEDKFGPDGDIYRTSDWRDPHVFWNEEEEEWWMLLAARENAPTERNGCVALCVSKDLHNWEYRKPLYAPRIHQAAHECPDFFKMGDWYYLVYSNYTDGFCTYYRMSKSPKGPWIRPAVDSFDGRAFYAAKTGCDGSRRYVYGWNPTKGENIWGIDPKTEIGKDYKTWSWGGAMEVHEIVQQADGALGVKPIDAVEKALRKPGSFSLVPATGAWNISKDSALSKSDDGMSCVFGGELTDLCRLSFTASYSGNPSRWGVALQVDESFSKGYYFSFEPGYNRIQFRSGLRMEEEGGKMFPYTVEMERPVILTPGKDYRVKIFIQNSLVVLYVDDNLAFSARMYDYRNRKFGFFVSDGTAEIKNIEYFTQ